MNESREEFAARLRRTMRSAVPKSAAAPHASPPARPAPAALPDWYLRRGARGHELAEAASAPALAPPLQPGHGHLRTCGMPRGIQTQENRRGSFGVRIERFAPQALHGTQRLEEVFGARGEALACLTGDAGLADFDPRTCTFLDIETTGLSGGAGTQVFQIGLLCFDGEGFELWQGFLRSPAEAAALLQACADRVRARAALVTFFGKSFDRHRLEDQMRLHHVDPPFEGRAHLDLYHPCRRLYAAAFPDGRLATMESALCGVRRERDLPGSFAPAAWFDFLAGREHLLEAVFLHNRLDVLSLVALCAHLSRALDADSQLPGSRARWSALVDLFVRRRDWLRVLEWSERALEVDPTLRNVWAARARALERSGRGDEARAAFAQLTMAGDGLAAQAWGELAQLLLAADDAPAALAAITQAQTLAEITLTGTQHARLVEKLARARAKLARIAQRRPKVHGANRAAP